MLRDGHAKGLALLGILHRLVDGAAHDAEAEGGDVGAGAVEGGHGQLEAVALCAKQVGRRDGAILEVDGGGVGAALPHLVLLLADGETGCVLGDNEGRNALVAGCGVAGGEDDNEVCVAAVGDPLLGAVEDKGVALALVTAAEACDVGACVGFAGRVGGEGEGARKTAEVLLLLLVGAGEEDGGRSEVVGRDGGGDADATVGELLADDGVLEGAQPEAAVLFGDLHIHEAEVEGLGADVAREGAVLVELTGDRDDDIAGEGAGGVADGCLLFGEFELVHGASAPSDDGSWRVYRAPLVPTSAKRQCGGRR